MMPIQRHTGAVVRQLLHGAHPTAPAASEHSPSTNSRIGRPDGTPGGLALRPPRIAAAGPALRDLSGRPPLRAKNRIELNDVAAPSSAWQSQLKSIRDAFYNSAGGKPDYCRAEFCFHRANLLAAGVAKQSQSGAKVLGWIEGTVDKTHQQEDSRLVGVTWGYHIAPLMQDEQGRRYIADPLHNEPIEIQSSADVAKWMNKSLGYSAAPHTEYRFIAPVDGNFAGMNTNDLQAMSADTITQSVMDYSGPPLGGEFADSGNVDRALLDLSIYRFGLAHRGMNREEGRQLVRDNTARTKEDAKAALANPLNLLKVPAWAATPQTDTHLHITPEVAEVARSLGRFASERLEI